MDTMNRAQRCETAYVIYFLEWVYHPVQVYVTNLKI